MRREPQLSAFIASLLSWRRHGSAATYLRNAADGLFTVTKLKEQGIAQSW